MLNRIGLQMGLLLVASACPIGLAAAGNEPIALVDFERYDRSCDVEISQRDSQIQVVWPIGNDRRAEIVFELAGDKPLIHSMGLASGGDDAFRSIAEGLDPVVWVRTGKRDLASRGGWTIFFDRMQRKPSELHLAALDRTSAACASRARRATLTLGRVSAGSFEGELRWTFYADSPLVLQEMVVSTKKNGVAYLYDAGLVCRDGLPDKLTWRDPLNGLKSQSAQSAGVSRPIAVGGRTICAQFDGGSLALFPPPHRYFYPLDFSDNLKNVWIGEKHHSSPLPFGFGMRHDPQGDNRFVPWFNAPPGSKQEMGLFWLVSDRSPEQTLEEVSRLTRQDRFAPLDGHTVFTSHYHVEHTREILNAQSDAQEDDRAIVEKLPSGGTYRIVPRLQNPGFVRVFREMGIDVAHLAEFHFGRTPRMDTEERVRHLEHLHAECRRLSDDEFLLLPGEEPNVHFGGHWISLFPRPVYWVLNRPEGTPFVTQHPQLGKVYHVGSAADVLRLLRAERGLAWTAHPRIKSSTGYPDRYRNELFFQSDRFLGAAWKAMPADLSQPRLGTRVLNLVDDMANWGGPKQTLGEVDVFKVEPDHELYAHSNVNYLRLEKMPRFEDGWNSILKTLRQGKFFVTTGEILVPDFTVDGKRSGEVARLSQPSKAKVRLELKWTFPLSCVEIISGDGASVERRRFDMSQTGRFGEEMMEFDVDLSNCRWVRVEAWDIATNGAFTQPVWLE